MTKSPHHQRCGRCKEVLALELFAPSDRGQDGTWCRSCFAAYHRGEDTWVPHDPRQCAECGKQYVPLILQGRALFCSKACQQQDYKKRRRVERLRSKVERSCLQCGGQITASRRSDAAFCSELCNSRAHAWTRSNRLRTGEERPTRMLSRIEIAERDGWRCGLCHKKVNPKLVYPHPRWGSMDHVIPVACGGSNEPANIQLAHLRCNLVKRQTAMGEQLRLV